VKISVFCSYSDKDRSYQRELQAQLSVMQRENAIDLWTFDEITAGTEWQHQVDEKLKEAKVVLLLLSGNFFSSEYCVYEMDVALRRQKAGDTVVVPILLRACDWDHSELARLQVLPNAKKPISRWKGKRDEAWKIVIDGIRKIVDSIAKTPRAPSPKISTSKIEEGEVKGIIRQFIDAFPVPVFAEPVEDVQLRRVIRASLPLPRVFYRWRGGEGVHWIVFAHLLLLRRVADLGFPLEFLIDDVCNGLDRQVVRPPVERMVTAMFPHGQAHCHWIADLYANRAEYSRHAQQSGFGLDASEQVLRASKTDFDARAQFWLEYLISLVGDDRRCIVYALKRHREIYESLRHAWAIESALVIRPLYEIGGLPAKSRSSSAGNVVVEPPQYRSLVSWLERADAADARDLVRYLTLDQLDADMIPAEALRLSMQEWNRSYFGDWT
jgi:hypothetical protein